MAKTIKVKHLEVKESNHRNKNQSHFYGWVYFNDHNRVRFASGKVFPSYWGVCTNRHLELAYTYLSEQKVKGFSRRKKG